MQQNTLMLAMCLNVSVIDCCLTHHQVWTLKRIFVGKIGMFLSTSHQISPRWPCSLTLATGLSVRGVPRGSWLPPPPILVGEGGRSYPPHYYLAPQIFKPSYGPVSYNVALWFRILGYVQLMILLILSHSSTCLYV